MKLRKWKKQKEKYNRSLTVELPTQCPTHRRFMNKRKSQQYGYYFYCPVTYCNYTESTQKYSRSITIKQQTR